MIIKCTRKNKYISYNFANFKNNKIKFLAELHQWFMIIRGSKDLRIHQRSMISEIYDNKWAKSTKREGFMQLKWTMEYNIILIKNWLLDSSIPKSPEENARTRFLSHTIYLFFFFLYRYIALFASSLFPFILTRHITHTFAYSFFHTHTHTSTYTNNTPMRKTKILLSVLGSPSKAL